MKTNLALSTDNSIPAALNSPASPLPNMDGLTALLGENETTSAFSNVLESLLEGVSCCDNDGRIIYTNSAMEKIVGLSSDQMLGKRTYELFFRAGTEQFLAAQTRQHARYADRQMGISEEYELEIVNQSGTQKWLLVRASPLKNARGEVVGSVAVVNDNTDKKSLQTQLLWSQKMDAVGRLARNVAHDFNNLLTVILGNSEWLLNQVTSEAPTYRKISAIHAASRSAAALTQQLLTVSKRKVLDLQPLDVNSIIRDTQAILRDFVTEGIQIELNLEKHLPYVIGDAGQIQQILINLAINARDAMSEGGVLTFSTSCLELPTQVSPVTSKKYISISVKDTGSGMSPDVLKHLFEPFFTTKKNGTGLGLSISHTIVEQHRGRICVSSQLGEGTTFSILLPESDSIPIASAPRETTLKLEQGNNELTILLAEDEPGVRELVSEMLTESGFNVISAADGMEALSILKSMSERVHLVLTDIAMPNINGITLAEKVQVNYPSIPIILMSGCTIDSALPDHIVASGIPFIAKPFAIDSLLRVIDNKLQTQVALKN